jgi:hypothetical protein
VGKGSVTGRADQTLVPGEKKQGTWIEKMTCDCREAVIRNPKWKMMY